VRRGIGKFGDGSLFRRNCLAASANFFPVYNAREMVGHYAEKAMGWRAAAAPLRGLFAAIREMAAGHPPRGSPATAAAGASGHWRLC
jgi:hypothetical protein